MVLQTVINAKAGGITPSVFYCAISSCVIIYTILKIQQKATPRMRGIAFFHGRGEVI